MPPYSWPFFVTQMMTRDLFAVAILIFLLVEFSTAGATLICKQPSWTEYSSFCVSAECFHLKA